MAKRASQTLYAGNKIEYYIHESNLIEGFDDPKMDKQSLHAWKYLTMQDELNHGVICKVQKMITLLQPEMQPHWRGYYRDLSKQRVWVGMREAPLPTLVPELMDQWIEAYQKLDAITNHINFEKIHPFVDGNGRTGRMLMWWQQINEGNTPSLIENDKKQFYYQWFK